MGDDSGSISDFDFHRETMCHAVERDKVGNITLTCDNLIGACDSATDTGAALIKPLQDVRVVGSARVPKRGASASPKNSDSHSDTGSPVLRTQRRPKVMCLNTSPESIAGDGLPVSSVAPVGVSTDVAASAGDTPVISSDDEGVSWFKPKKRGKPNKGKPAVEEPKLQNLSKPIRMDSVDRVSLTMLGETIGSSELAGMPTASIGACGIEWADALDECRAKSRNLQGGVSGLMKQYIAQLKDVIVTLVGKAEVAGNPSLLMTRTDELSKRLKIIQGDNTIIKRALAEAKKRIKELEDQVQERVLDFSRKSASVDLPMDSVFGDSASEDVDAIVSRVLREHDLSPLTSSAITDVVRRPSIKGVSSIISDPVDVPDVLAERSERGVVLSNQINALKDTRRSFRDNVSGLIGDSDGGFVPAEGGNFSWCYSWSDCSFGRTACSATVWKCFN